MPNTKGKRKKPQKPQASAEGGDGGGDAGGGGEGGGDGGGEAVGKAVVKAARKASAKAGAKAGDAAGDSAGGKANKKARRVKDHAKPKRARNPYAFYLQAVRPKVAEEHPGMGFVDVGKEVSRRWNLLSPEAKAPFLQLAADDKARAKTELGSYVDPDPAVLKARQTATHNVQLVLSPGLRQLLGAPEVMSRFQVVKELHAYFKAQGLKDPQDKRFVLADEPLRQLFGEDRFLAIAVTRLLRQHVHSAGGAGGGDAPPPEEEAEEEAEEEEEEAGAQEGAAAGPAAVDSSGTSDTSSEEESEME